MSNAYNLKMTAEQAKEVPMVDLAFQILKSSNTTYYYRDLMTEIAKIKGLSEEEMLQVIAQLYTEINIDGRFACVGNNMWGLKRWYPVEKSDDGVGGAQRPRIINDDFEEEEEEETYTEEEDFDKFDDDAEFVEVEEEEEFFEDEEIDEEETTGEPEDDSEDDEELDDAEDEDEKDK